MPESDTGRALGGYQVLEASVQALGNFLDAINKLPNLILCWLAFFVMSAKIPNITKPLN